MIGKYDTTNVIRFDLNDCFALEVFEAANTDFVITLDSEAVRSLFAVIGIAALGAGIPVIISIIYETVIMAAVDLIDKVSKLINYKIFFITSVVYSSDVEIVSALVSTLFIDLDIRAYNFKSAVSIYFSVYRVGNVIIVHNRSVGKINSYRLCRIAVSKGSRDNVVKILFILNKSLLHENLYTS